MHKDPNHSLFIGSKQLKLPSCHSTNAVASDLLADTNTVEGTVVLTDYQTAGRGQRGNLWESHPGKNLTLSVILKPDFLPVNRQFDLTVITSLALVETLNDLGLPQARIKWPNDIYLNDSKIAGILIENTVRANQLEWAILGIGLNINQSKFTTPGATSTKLALKHELELDFVLLTLLKRLNEFYEQLKEQKSIRPLYTDRLMWLGEKRNFKNSVDSKSFSGVIKKITDDGRLIIVVENEDRSFDFKEVIFLV